MAAAVPPREIHGAAAARRVAKQHRGVHAHGGAHASPERAPLLQRQVLGEPRALQPQRAPRAHAQAAATLGAPTLDLRSG